MDGAAPESRPEPAFGRLEGERLGAEITELCGYLYAGTYRLLTLIRAFDEKGYWGGPGVCSCAHWLNFKCGIGMNAAREKVRVAHALAKLPRISAAFARGELSYSKVRAMTRIADETNEDYLLMIARHGTAYHVEQLVSKYRRCLRLQETATANAQHEARELTWRYDENGALVLQARLPAEQGALVLKALSAAVDRQREEARGGGEEPVPVAAARADALAELAESSLQGQPEPARTADRYQVVVHVSADALRGVAAQNRRAGVAAQVAADGAAEPAPEVAGAGVSAETSASEPGREPVSSGGAQRVSAETSPYVNEDLSHLEDGPRLAAETSRRLACDASRVLLVEGGGGEPLAIGRKSRSIPPALRRALRARDDGCRFPGCTRKHCLDGHHIRHWADGGETSLTNLVQLCRYHHRLVHEGGYGCERLADGRVVFTDPDNVPLAASAAPSPLAVAEGEEDAWIRARCRDLDIDADTCVPLWYAGETIDWHLAVGHLFH